MSTASSRLARSQRMLSGRIHSPSRIARAAVSSLALVALACAAQAAPAPAAPAPGVGVPGVGVPGVVAPAPAPAADGPVGATPTAAAPPQRLVDPRSQRSAVASGTVSRFLINPEGDVDGFLLVDGSLVRFPPPMGSLLVSAVRPGDAVRVIGLRDEAGNLAAQQIINSRTSQQIVDQPPAADALQASPASRGAALAKLSVTGTIARVTTAPRGETDGVILSDGTIIKMPPPAAQQFANLLRPDVAVAARGYGTRNQYGEALQATAFGTPENVTPLYNDIPN
jgi:hypothetical protein